jgi:hypothetical protein
MSTNIRNEEMKNGSNGDGSRVGSVMTNEEINKLADEGAKLLSYEDYCRHVLLEGTPDAISLDAATKKLAWKQHAACLAKAKNEGRKSTLNLEEYVQQAKKMGERIQATWQKFLPLKANISYALEAWWKVGRRLDETRKTWTEQTEQTVREWQHKAARVVELIFPPKGDTEPRESDVSNPFPLEVLPPVIKDLAVSFSETWETPPETVALCMLTVASASLVKWVFAISDKGKPIRGNIFTYISLSASGNKSIAFDEAMDPVIRHNEARREYDQEVELDDLNAEIEELELEIKKLKKQAETDNGLNKGALAELYRKKRKAEAKLKFWSIQSSDFTIQATKSS